MFIKHYKPNTDRAYFNMIISTNMECLVQILQQLEPERSPRVNRNIAESERHLFGWSRRAPPQKAKASTTLMTSVAEPVGAGTFWSGAGAGVKM